MLAPFDTVSITFVETYQIKYVLYIYSSIEELNRKVLTKLTKFSQEDLEKVLDNVWLRLNYTAISIADILKSFGVLKSSRVSV